MTTKRYPGLQSLLAESLKINEHLQSPSTVTRNLSQLQYQSRRYRPASKGVDPSTQSRAQMFYGDRFDVREYAKLKRKMEEMPINNTQEAITDLDVEKALKYEHAKNTHNAIEESIKMTAHIFRVRHRKRLEDDWTKAKKHILEERDHPMANAPKLQLQGQPMESETPAIEHYATGFNLGDNKMNYYAEVVRKISDTNRAGMIEQFKLACEKAERSSWKASQNRNPADSEIQECWNLIRTLVSCRDGSQPKSWNNYQSDTKLQYKLMATSTKMAEHQYCKFVENEIRRKQARVGSDPSNENKIKAFLNILRNGRGRLSEKVRDLYSKSATEWALIYYCYRCGFLEEASMIANESLRPRENYEKFVEAINNELKTPESPLQGSLDTEYTQHGNPNEDPFCEAMYCLLQAQRSPANSLMKQAGVIEGPTDRIWFRLKCIQRRAINLSQQKEGLAELEKMKEEIFKKGAKFYTNSGAYPFIYFKVLLLSLQFERAVNYLVRRKYFRDGIHYAIALAHHGLLRYGKTRGYFSYVPGTSIVDLVRYVSEYVKRFAGNPKDAALAKFFYFKVLHLRDRRPEEDSKDEVTASQKEIIKLLLDKSASQYIFPLKDPRRLLDDSLGGVQTNKILAKAMDQAARRADDKILVLRLGFHAGREMYAKTLKTAEEYLFEIVPAKPTSQEQQRFKEELLHQAFIIYDERSDGNRKEKENINRLIELAKKFFDKYHSGQYQSIHQYDIKYLPYLKILQRREFQEMVRNFHDHLDPGMRRVYEKMAVAIMHIYRSRRDAHSRRLEENLIEFVQRVAPGSDCLRTLQDIQAA